ncbi:MAG: M15 family metallopeptidase [Bacteriovoracaceae bacterium]
MNTDIILGKTMAHLVPLVGTKFLVHSQMREDFLRLQKRASEAGFNLQVISAFRDYNRQLKIWNAKARGERTLMDDFGSPLVYQILTPTEVMFSILRWSALPGASRHHWGSDIDIFDERTQKPEDVQLTPQECESGGPAAELHDWLDIQINNNQSFGFFRPFSTDTSGVSPERWHLSYWPVSHKLSEQYTFDLFQKNIEQSPLELKEIVLENLQLIYKKYVMTFDLPPF